MGGGIGYSYVPINNCHDRGKCEGGAGRRGGISTQPQADVCGTPIDDWVRFGDRRGWSSGENGSWTRYGSNWIDSSRLQGVVRQHVFSQ